MPEEVRDRSIADTFFNAIDKPAAVSRSLMIDAFTKEGNSPAIKDILSSKESFSARQFINEIENISGIDFTAGPEDPADQTGLQKAANIVRDIAVDIVTDPTTLIPVAKIARLSGLTKATIGNKASRKAIGKTIGAFSETGSTRRKLGALAVKGLAKKKIQDRVITGTTIGALSIDSNDSILDIMLKVGAGSVAGGSALKGLKEAGKAGGKIGGASLDAISNKLFKESIDKLNTPAILKQFKGKNISITEASAVNKAARKRVRPLERQAFEASTQLEKDIILDYKKAGLSPEQIEEKLLTLDAINAAGFSDIVGIRKIISSSLKEKFPEESANKIFGISNIISNKITDLNFRGRNLDSFSDLGEARFNLEFEKFSLPKSKNVLTSQQRNLIKDIKDPRIQAALKADESHAVLGAIDSFKDPLLNKALGKTVDKNNKLIRSLNRQFDIEGRSHLRFLPLNFHKVDLSGLADQATESAKVALKEGAHKRVSETIEIAGDKATRDLSKSVGARNFANMALTESELRSRKLMVEVFKEADKAKFGEGFGETIKSTLNFYDKALSLMKTQHLVSSTNWIINNYPDNVFKAFMAGGLNTTGRAALEPLAGTAKLAIDRIGTAMGIQDLKAFSNFKSGNAFRDIFNAQKPENLSSIYNYGDDWIGASSAYNVVEHNRAINLQKTGLDDLLIGESSKSPDKVIGSILGGKIKLKSTGVSESKTVQDKISNAVTGYQEALWGTMGRFGGGMEDSMRYVTWRGIMDSLKDKYPMASKGFDLVNGNPMKIVEVTDPKFLRKNKGILTANEKQIKINDEILDQQNKIGRKLTQNEASSIVKKLTDNFNKVEADVSKKFGPKQTENLEAIRQADLMMKDASIKTNSAFFDYSDTTAFEDLVMKRVFPYWTYASNSSRYVTDKIFDPQGLRRITAASKIPSNLGRKPTEEERLGLPAFLLNRNTRISNDGESTVSLPNFSVLDTLSLLDTDEVGNRVSPIIKTPLSILTNKNFFTGGTLFPSQKEPVKRIFEGKETLLPDSILELANVFRKDNGQLFTNSKAAVLATEIGRNLVPFPLLDTIARASRNIDFRTDKTGDVLDHGVEIAKEMFFVKSRPLDKKRLKSSTKRTRKAIKRFESSDKNIVAPEKKTRSRRKTRTKRTRRSLR